MKRDMPTIELGDSTVANRRLHPNLAKGVVGRREDGRREPTIHWTKPCRTLAALQGSEPFTPFYIVDWFNNVSICLACREFVNVTPIKQTARGDKEKTWARM